LASSIKTLRFTTSEDITRETKAKFNLSISTKLLIVWIDWLITEADYTVQTQGRALM
jgi:hypothetical protein